jgi:Amt family ammonium transporter
MTLPGLALFYGGLTRSRNVLSILMQCFVICGIATLVWLICGYSLAFTDGGSANSFIGGLGKVLFAGVLKSSVEGTIPESAFASIQMIGVIAVLIYEHRNFRDS